MRKINKKILVLFIIGIFITFSFGIVKINSINQKNLHLSNDIDINYEWKITWGGNYNEYAEDVVIDSFGNIYLVGNTYDSEIYEDYVLCLVKFDDSRTYQWNRTWGGSESDRYEGIAVDSLGNIYIGGTTESYGNGDEELFLLKYNNSGALKWNITWGGVDLDRCGGIAIDSADNIYITGYSQSFGHKDFLIKYSDSGNQYWNRSFINTNFISNAIAIDSFDDIYLTGNYYTSNWDFGLVKYNSSGDLLMYTHYGESGYDEAFDIAIAPSGNIYLTGRSDSFGAGDWDVYTVKYNYSGIPLWNCTWGEDDDNWPNAIALDSSENSHIMVSSRSDHVGNSSLIIINQTGNLIGAFTWKYEGLEDVYFSNIFIDSSDQIYLAGGNGGNMILVKLGTKSEDKQVVPGFSIFLLVSLICIVYIIIANKNMSKYSISNRYG